MTITRTSISIITLATLLTFAGFVYTAQAQEEPTPRERFLEMQAEAKEKRENFEDNKQEQKEEFIETRTELREELEGNREEFQAQSEERKEEMREKIEVRKEALQERTQERIANLAANVSNRMEAAIARIQQIINRFQARMDALAERGVDVTAAQEALDEAQGHLNDASVAIANIDSVVAEVIGSESPREAWGSAKETYGAIKADIKAAHTSLRSALALLKETVTDGGLAPGTSSAVADDDTGAEDEEGSAE